MAERTGRMRTFRTRAEDATALTPFGRSLRREIVLTVGAMLQGLGVAAYLGAAVFVVLGLLYAYPLDFVAGPAIAMVALGSPPLVLGWWLRRAERRRDETSICPWTEPFE